MYDVIYIDAHGSETSVAQHVDNRKEATDVARQAAADVRPARAAVGALEDEASDSGIDDAGA